jgi:hypothetical protein
MSTVFVTQETNHDFAKAEEFGDIKFMLAPVDDLNNIKNSLHNERVLLELRRLLKSYNEESDWIVIAGSPYVSAAVFFILGQMSISRVRILRWDNRDHSYRPMYLQLRKEENHD